MVGVVDSYNSFLEDYGYGGEEGLVSDYVISDRDLPEFYTDIEYKGGPDLWDTIKPADALPSDDSFLGSEILEYPKGSGTDAVGWDDSVDNTWLDDFREWRDDNIAGEILDFAAGAMRLTDKKQRAGMQRAAPTRRSRGAGLPGQEQALRRTTSPSASELMSRVQQMTRQNRRVIEEMIRTNKIPIGDALSALTEPKPSGPTIKSSDYKIARLASRLT